MVYYVLLNNEPIVANRASKVARINFDPLRRATSLCLHIGIMTNNLKLTIAIALESDIERLRVLGGIAVLQVLAPGFVCLLHVFIVFYFFWFSTEIF